MKKSAFDLILNWRIVREFACPARRHTSSYDPKYPPDDTPEPEDAPFEADEEQENKRATQVPR